MNSKGKSALLFTSINKSGVLENVKTITGQIRSDIYIYTHFSVQYGGAQVCEKITQILF